MTDRRKHNEGTYSRLNREIDSKVKKDNRKRSTSITSDDLQNYEDFETLSTRDWIDAAKTILIRDGIDGVKIDRIAKQCGVTRGGFYWRFKGRSELLEALIEEWKHTNTAPLLAALSTPGSPAERFKAAASLWIAEQDFDPGFDTAVRHWALTSKDVADVVRKIDEQRIDAFRSLFSEAGYNPDEALVRARVVYFHQIGYYALQFQESSTERQRLSEIYFQVLTGFDEFENRKSD